MLYIGEVIGLLTLPLAAFLGALGSMLLVLGVASRGGRLGSDRLLLAGVAVSFVLLALANLLLFLGDHRAASSVLFWMLGGLGLARWSLIWLPALCVAGGLLVLLGLGRALNALMAGEQTAVTLGLDARRVRLWVFVCCSLLTGVLVSVSGAIGFVGLMLPHAPAGGCRAPPTAAGVRPARRAVPGLDGCRRAHPDRPPGPAHRHRHRGHRRAVLHSPAASPQLIRTDPAGSSGNAPRCLPPAAGCRRAC